MAHRNLLVVVAHFLWVIPATTVLSTVKGFFGVMENKNLKKDNIPTPSSSQEIEGELEENIAIIDLNNNNYIPEKLEGKQ